MYHSSPFSACGKYVPENTGMNQVFNKEETTCKNCNKKYPQWLIYENTMKTKSILDYCYGHLDKMWASHIVGILLNCDFRDAKENSDIFYKKLNEIISG